MESGVDSQAYTTLCRFLTGALEEVSKQSGLGQAFLGLIVLPIAGNACEHITAVFVACRNKMDLAIGVALGSSIQVPPRMLAARAAQAACLPCALACTAHYKTPRRDRLASRASLQIHQSGCD